MDTQHEAAAGETPLQSHKQRGAHAARRRELIMLYAAIALGSIIGSDLRWLASVGALALLGAGFPWGTLFVNVTGSLAIGFYAALSGPDGRLFVTARMRHFVMTGVCGGYTTFSMFSLETLRLFQRGALVEAALNIVVSVLTWLGAVWLGDALASQLNRLKGG